MEDPTKYLTDCIYSYILGTPIANSPQSRKLIKVNKEKLKQLGDLSFSLNSMIWGKAFPGLPEENKILEIDYQNIEMIVKAADDFQKHGSIWILPLSHIKICNYRCQIFLNRNVTTEVILKYVLSEPSYGFHKKKSEKRIYFKALHDEDTCESELSAYRMKLTANVLKIVTNYSDWLEVYDKNDALTVQFISMSNPRIHENNSSNSRVALVKVGIVQDPSNKKIAKISTSEYMRLRSNDMRLMAMHKYGIRIKDEAKFSDLIDNLGISAVCVDFLEVKHSSPVQIVRNSQGSTKGASFILYNSARIETLLRTFDERVANNLYRKLPEIHDIDFSLLGEEEEWQLLYGYIFSFPDLIHRCVEQLEKGSLSLHLIINYLNGLVSTFSVYYRRVRILMESRIHLMPYVYVRIYLVKAIRIILNRTLSLLSIAPVQFM